MIGREPPYVIVNSSCLDIGFVSQCAHAQIRAAELPCISLWFAVVGVDCSDVFFAGFSKGKRSCVDLFEVSLANMTKARYQNIRKLCSGVFWRKQAMHFAPARHFGLIIGVKTCQTYG